MNEPITTIDPRYSDPRAVATSWEETRRVLETAELFWLATGRADGRPHVTPVVGVWHDGALYFSTAETEQKAINMRANPHVILTRSSPRRSTRTAKATLSATPATSSDFQPMELPWLLMAVSLGPGRKIGARKAPFQRLSLRVRRKHPRAGWSSHGTWWRIRRTPAKASRAHFSLIRLDWEAASSCRFSCFSLAFIFPPPSTAISRGFPSLHVRSLLEA